MKNDLDRQIEEGQIDAEIYEQIKDELSYDDLNL